MNTERLKTFAVGALIFNAMAALSIAVALLFTGCRAPTPPWVSGTIDCGIESVRKHGPSLLPVVNKCLTMGKSDAWACLDGLPSVVGVGLDVVACVVRASGSDAKAAAGDNRADVLSASMAERAEGWIGARKFEFSK